MNLAMPKNINIGLPQKIKASRNFIVEIVLLLVFCVLFFWFLVLPKKAEVSAKQDVLEQTLSQQQLADTQLGTLKQLILNLNSHKDEVASLDEAIPLKGNVLELQILMENLANSAGVTVGDISLNASQNGIVAGNTSLLANPYASARSLLQITGSVYVFGNFPQLEAFMKKLENSGRIFDVSSFEVSSGQANNLSLRMSLKAYYFAPKE